MAPLLTLTYLLTYSITHSLNSLTYAIINNLLTSLTHPLNEPGTGPQVLSQCSLVLLTHLLCSSKPLTLLSIDQSINLTVCLLFLLNRYRDRPSSGASVHYTDGLTLD